VTERPENLPDYRRPPIDEVAVAIQFQEIEGCSNEHLREFWKTVRQDYPFVENRPRLEIPLESPGPSEPTAVQLQLSSTPPLDVRMWLISESDDFLIQVQDTTFIQNWRRRGSEYPHFEKVRDLFWENFRKFREFLSGAGLPPPQSQQVEVTYINWISDLPMAGFLRPATEARISIATSKLEPEEQSWNARYLIPNALEVVERLYVQASPAMRAQEEAHARGIQFLLVVRAAKIDGIGDAEATRLIDDARVTIVEAFTALTAPNAQRVWERFQ
jgi:uncharacterized protein (TIGR04255 family)